MLPSSSDPAWPSQPVPRGAQDDRAGDHDRVEILEQKVQGLETLPARVEAVELQIVQLRDEIRGEFSAVRHEMRTMGAGLRDEIRADDEALRAELISKIETGDEETRRQMRFMHEELVSKIETGDEETRRYVRVLHEEVIARIEILGDARRPGKKR